MMIQILLPPEGKSPDNRYNINRDLAHVFDKLVRQVVLDMPEDSVTPKPSTEEIAVICDTFADIFVAVKNPNETPDTVGARLDKLPPAFRAAFERALTLNLFKRFTKWKREIAPKTVEVKLDVVK
jgi:hypothetical protein